MDVPNGTSEDFQLIDFSKLLFFKVRTLRSSLAFLGFTVHPLIVHSHALTWCTRDNPVRAQKCNGNTVQVETLRELLYTVHNDSSLPVTSLIKQRCYIKTGDDCMHVDD